MPFPCSLMWCYHKVRIGLCKGGDERNSRCQKKDWQIPGPPTRAGKVFTSDSWERLTIGTSRHTITIRSISETLEGNLLGKKNLPCVDSERQPGELVLQSHKSTKIPKNCLFFFSCSSTVFSVVLRLFSREQRPLAPTSWSNPNQTKALPTRCEQLKKG